MIQRIATFATFATCIITTFTTACNVLSFSGGGSFGAVEVGILDTLVTQHRIPPFFDTVTGISAGGLNAALLSYYNNVVVALPLMKHMYSTLRNADVYYSDTMNIFQSWSIYNNAPLEKYLRGILNELSIPVSAPNVLIGATNLLTQQLNIFQFNGLSLNDKMDVLMSTTAIPIVFPPRKFNQSMYIDGGLISNEIIREVLTMINCSWYNITFINARPKTDTVPITGLFTYIGAVLDVLLATFDSELVTTRCQSPKGEINACYPTDPLLNHYSVLDFDHGVTLYESGQLHFECVRYDLCM